LAQRGELKAEHGKGTILGLESAMFSSVNMMIRVGHLHGAIPGYIWENMKPKSSGRCQVHRDYFAAMSPML
jgi:hypothetical protein